MKETDEECQQRSLIEFEAWVRFIEHSIDPSRTNYPEGIHVNIFQGFDPIRMAPNIAKDAKRRGIKTWLEEYNGKTEAQ